MRGDGVGVGDIGEVQGDARSPGDTAAGDDGGGAGREQDAGVVGGRGGLERDASTEPSGDRVGVGDGARGEHGACDAHGTDSGGAHGVRGDGVGVGDLGEVPGVAQRAGGTAGDDDGGGAKVSALHAKLPAAHDDQALRGEDARVAPPLRVSTQAHERAFFWASVAMTGYAMIRIEPDGNCLFHAIADQLNREDDAMPWNHATLRATAVRYMAENRNVFVEAPLPNMDQVGTWGGSPEIRALSLALKRQIAVLSAAQADGWQIFPENWGLSDLEQTILADVNQAPLRVAILEHHFSGNAHYNSVVTGPRAKGSGCKRSLPWAQDSSPNLPQLSGAVTRSGRGQAVKCSSPAKISPQASSGAEGKRVPTGVPEKTAAAADQQETENVGAPDAAIASGGADGWQCLDCTLLNDDKHLCCFVCNAERPAAFARAEKRRKKGALSTGEACPAPAAAVTQTTLPLDQAVAMINQILAGSKRGGGATIPYLAAAMHAVSICDWEEVSLAGHVSVMRKFLDTDLCDRLRANQPPTKAQKISNTSTSARNDGSRTQEDLSKELKDEVASAVLLQLKTYVPCASPLTLVTPKLLRSKQSTKTQCLHSDFLDGERQKHVQAHGTAPGTVLVSLQSGGQLWILSKDGGTIVRLLLGCGDAVWFDANVMHAGAAYGHQHARIHMYVTHAQFVRDAMKSGAHEQLHTGSRERLPTDVDKSVLYTDP